MLLGMSHHVVAVALPGVVAFDLSTAAQVFGVKDEDEYRFTVATPTGETVSTSTDFEISGSGGMQDIERADTVVIPGYRPCGAVDVSVTEALVRAHSRGARLVSICVGAFQLAATGLLDGLQATTHWQDASELQRRHPHVLVQPDVLYIDHGHIATSAGVAAGIDLCLHLVRTDFGPTVANRIARRMVVAPHRRGGQAQFVTPGTEVSTGGSTVDSVAEWAIQRLDQPLGVADLAAHANMSERQLTRRFITESGASPFQWLLHQRTLRAMDLLERTDLPPEAVATEAA